MKLNKSWLVPGLVGIGLGYLFSHTISNFAGSLGLPLHSMQGRVHHGRPSGIVHRAPVHPATHPVSAPMHYVPVRRSFDRSYDSWLHTTVNALPPVG